MSATKLLSKFILAAMLLTALCSNAFADGFPLRPGRLIISPSVNYFVATKKWDSTGVKQNFDHSGKFTSQSYSLYMEYGVSRRFTIISSVPYIINNYKQTNFNSTSSGLADLETGIKYYLANINYKYYFSLQATAITPLYKDTNLGYEEEGAELKAAFAGGGHLFGKSSFFDLDNGFRRYFGASGPWQDRYSVTYGLTLNKSFKDQVSATFSGFYTESSYKKFNTLNPSASKNFAFKQASLSYGHMFGKRLSVFLSGGQFLDGRNTGDGTSGSVSFIYRTDFK